MARRNDGSQLERDFANWLESEHGYRSTTLNKHISPDGGHTYEVDVYATKVDRRSLKIAKLGWAGYTILFLFVFFGGQQAEATLVESLSFLTPEYASYAVFIYAGVGALLYFFGMKQLETKTYAECKDHRRKVGRPIVSQLVGRMNTLGDAERRDKGREEWMLVSSQGFSGPALEAANAHGIQCYSRSENGFIRH